MEFEIKSGTDGRAYAAFLNEYVLDQYCEQHNITPDVFCVDGYMNGILLDYVVTE